MLSTMQARVLRLLLRAPFPSGAADRRTVL